MTTNDTHDKYTLRQRMYGAKGLELLHRVGRSGITSVIHDTHEHEIMLQLEGDGYVKKVAGDWMLTVAGVDVFNSLFDPGTQEARNLFKGPNPD